MRILGLSGSFNTTSDPWVPGLPRGFFHDAAAALVQDGEVVAAVEEERCNRIKHTHDFPLQAVSACLSIAGTDLSSVDEIAFFFAEDFLDSQLAQQSLGLPELPMPGARGRLATLLGLDAADERLYFVPHHVAHAASTFYQSGLRRATVLVMDGHGEAESTSAYRAGPGGLSLVSSVPESASLGQLYFRGTRFVGFRLFDEYKVMGLAPYGDPARYRRAFRSLYELLLSV
jgi:7-O-carbamoyltransferase